MTADQMPLPMPPGAREAVDEAPKLAWPDPLPAWPCVTSDGLTWLDLWGREPVVGADGKLLREFFAVGPHGRAERWTVGTRLRPTPAQDEAYCVGLRAARERAAAKEARHRS